MVGGGSPRVLRTAGRLADIVSINFDNSAGKIGAHGIGSGTPAGTADKVGLDPRGRGRSPWPISRSEIGAYFTTVTDDGEATREKMGAAFGMSGERARRLPPRADRLGRRDLRDAAEAARRLRHQLHHRRRRRHGRIRPRWSSGWPAPERDGAGHERRSESEWSSAGLGRTSRTSGCSTRRSNSALTPTTPACSRRRRSSRPRPPARRCTW